MAATFGQFPAIFRFSGALFTAAILMQKFLDSVKLTCPENQCHIMRRLENWKHEDLAYQGIHIALNPISQCSEVSICPLPLDQLGVS